MAKDQTVVPMKKGKTAQFTKGVSFPNQDIQLVRDSELKAHRLFMSWSAYILSLIARDIGNDPPSNLRPRAGEEEWKPKI